jgi:hypothetical protein
MTLRTLGLGAAANAPSTFGSISSPPGLYNFGPSMIVSNRTTDLDPFTVANATLGRGNPPSTNISAIWLNPSKSSSGSPAGGECPAVRRHKKSDSLSSSEAGVTSTGVVITALIEQLIGPQQRTRDPDAERALGSSDCG